MNPASACSVANLRPEQACFQVVPVGLLIIRALILLELGVVTRLVCTCWGANPVIVQRRLLKCVVMEFVADLEGDVHFLF